MLKSTEIGRPVVLRKDENESYHRIVEHVEGAAKWNDLVSQVRVSTPHGTITQAGIGFLDEMTKEELAKLKEYENDARSKKIPLYAGKLTLK